jgi:hypothetical protein
MIEAAIRFRLFKYYEPFCKEQNDTVMREVRSIKATVHIWKCINLFSTSMYCYITFKDNHFLHFLFGGKAKDFAESLKGYPYIDRSEYPTFKNYFLISMAYHVSSIVPMFYSASKKDLVEMILHHACTIFLYAGGYMMNIWEAAGTFGFIHDISDVPLMLVKVFSESRKKTLAGVLFLFTTIFWAYCRMFALGWIIYETATICPPVVKWTSFQINTFVGLMSTLCMMHHYWFFLFLGILKTFLTVG